MSSPQPDLTGKARMLALIALAEFLAMAVWFSASSVVPALTEAWDLSDSGKAWLTMSVQIGFVVGALGSALLNLADRIPPRHFMAVAALLAAANTALIPAVANGITVALILRFLTGVCLAGVYPVGMKLITTWTKEDRGLGIGLLVGALTMGSAAPHLLNALGGVGNWKTVLYLAAALAASGGIINFAFVCEGPYRSSSAPFNWKYVGEILSQRDLVLANLGYLGHMWELYAMWAWIPAFFLASFERSGIDEAWASAAAFAVIGFGGFSSWLAGKWADQFGRTSVTIGALGISGSCAMLVGRLYGGNAYLLVAFCLIWGLAVIADSAQFSACISELCRAEYIGTALTLQTSLGFLLTLVSIRLIPVFERQIGWQWAFATLAVGPVIGIWAMASLRRSPAAVKLAHGRG